MIKNHLISAAHFRFAVKLDILYDLLYIFALGASGGGGGDRIRRILKHDCTCTCKHKDLMLENT
jgi:hypothetical protein